MNLRSGRRAESRHVRDRYHCRRRTRRSSRRRRAETAADRSAAARFSSGRWTRSSRTAASSEIVVALPTDLVERSAGRSSTRRFEAGAHRRRRRAAAGFRGERVSAAYRRERGGHRPRCGAAVRVSATSFRARLRRRPLRCGARRAVRARYRQADGARLRARVIESSPRRCRGKRSSWRRRRRHSGVTS